MLAFEERFEIFMRNARAGVFVGLLAAGVGVAALFAACADAADDCRNTRTCPAPPCNMDAGDPLNGLDAGCCQQQDGGFVCAP